MENLYNLQWNINSEIFSMILSWNSWKMIFPDHHVDQAMRISARHLLSIHSGWKRRRMRVRDVGLFPCDRAWSTSTFLFYKKSRERVLTNSQICMLTMLLLTTQKSLKKKIFIQQAHFKLFFSVSKKYFTS